MRHEPTHRVLSVVQALAIDGPPLPLAELARVTGASRSTLHAVLAEMESQAWAEKVGGGWRAGPRLREVGTALAAEVDLVRAAREPLEALADATGIAAVVFEVRDGMAEVVDSVGAGMRTASREAMPVGHVVPVRAPFARELAARLPVVEQRRWLADSAGLTPAARDRLEMVLPQIARRGWSIERLTPARRELLRMADSLEASGIGALVRDRVSELFVELSEIDVTNAELDAAADLAVASIAAPVLRADGRAIGSVAVAPGRRMTGRAVARATRAVSVCADSVSARLASRPGRAPAAGLPPHLVHPAHAARHP
ncbi:helix-turn-helix domain-containing protein [Dietzia maris]|uniref:helix-turn-helix domain-containing protein n=1 Tax=Dietzia maris TaxID=37915 RepID=UPI0021AF9674|nr:helix-turn-helix domain-containing protein [Dietzia maris]MCT1433726.1 helix-turn-helix domain-containing protein [Dietzia maris]MCT1519872.1 helix-turn-helix domain-containing protein [Dietzia maris]